MGCLLLPYLARRRSLFFVFGASTTVCVLVRLWMVVMQPWAMPSFSWMTWQQQQQQQEQGSGFWQQQQQVRLWMVVMQPWQMPILFK
jgi:hypothetical protein